MGIFVFLDTKYDINTLTWLGFALASKPQPNIDGGAVMDWRMQPHVQADSI